MDYVRSVEARTADDAATVVKALARADRYVPVTVKSIRNEKPAPWPRWRVTLAVKVAK